MKKSFFKYLSLFDKLFKVNHDKYNITCKYINIMNSYYNYFFYKKD